VQEDKVRIGRRVVGQRARHGRLKESHSEERIMSDNDLTAGQPLDLAGFLNPDATTNLSMPEVLAELAMPYAVWVARNPNLPSATVIDRWFQWQLASFLAKIQHSVCYLEHPGSRPDRFRVVPDEGFLRIVDRFRQRISVPQPAGSDSVAGGRPENPAQFIVHSNECPDCAAEVGQLHRRGCAQEICPYCGDPPTCCECEHGCDGVPDDDRMPWTGDHPLWAACREFGWYVNKVPGREGWTPCKPDEPGAVEDVDRLFRDAVWDRQAKRWVKKEGR
jgi:hypothetical protein